jgi:thymidylate synthase (FAD)
VDTKIDCLDHGFVRLVDYMGSDLSVVRAARVSYDAEPRNDGSDAKLIHYLWKNKHVSPFEAVTFTFEVKAPIFVFRQWHRHNSWRFNEVSARYSELPEEFYVPALDQITTQSMDNKQMRTEKQNPHANLLQHDIHNAGRYAFKVYHEMLRDGCPRELARMVLPMGTYSRMFATANLRSLFHFLELRMHSHAQHEIRVFAQAMMDIVRPIVPICCDAFDTAKG